MKKTALISLSLLFCAIVTGQTLQDKQTVIQKCLDLESLQQYYDNIEYDGKKQLFIVDNGVLPVDMKLFKFENQVLFMPKKEMFFKNIKNHIDFLSFAIDAQKAEVNFRYGIKGPSVHVKLKKKKNNWKIVESDIKDSNE
jgi:hypothetical protein